MRHTILPALTAALGVSIYLDGGFSRAAWQHWLALVAVTAQGLVCLHDMARASRRAQRMTQTPLVLGQSASPLRIFNPRWR